MRILFIRHAEPDYTVDSLTPKGWTEAELLSQRLVRVPIRDFYVSPLGRAKDTASLTLKKLNRTAETLPWLQEFRGTVPDPETGEKRWIAWDLKPRIWSGYPGIMDFRSWIDAPVFDHTNVREIWKETTDGVDELLGRYGFRKDGPVWLVLCMPSSVSEVVTEERIKGEVAFRITRLGDLTHLEAAGENRSTAGLFPECFTGIDSTDPAENGTPITLA